MCSVKWYLLHDDIPKRTGVMQVCLNACKTGSNRPMLGCIGLKQLKISSKEIMSKLLHGKYCCKTLLLYHTVLLLSLVEGSAGVSNDMTILFKYSTQSYRACICCSTKGGRPSRTEGKPGLRLVPAFPLAFRRHEHVHQSM